MRNGRTATHIKAFCLFLVRIIDNLSPAPVTTNPPGEAKALHNRIDCEVQNNICDHLNKATKKHGQELVTSVLTDCLAGEEPEAVEEEVNQPETMDNLLLRLFPDCRTGVEKDHFVVAHQRFAGNRRWSGLLKAGIVRAKNGKVYRCRS
jgi:hypothetical protein